VAINSGSKSDIHFSAGPADDPHEQYKNDIINQGASFFDFTTVTFDSEVKVNAYW